jgi:hypothetical protein
MVLKHLHPFLASFAAEIDKQAGIKEDLKAGTQKLVSTLKKVPQHANNAALKAAVKVHQLPGGDKVMAHGPDLLRKLVT